MNQATRRLRWWKEVLAVIAFDAVYEWTSEKASGAHAVAGHHAQQIVNTERWLGIFRERPIQHWFLPHRLLIEASDLYYSTVHFVLPVVTLVWLFRRFPERYVHWRNALAWMTALGLIGFITFPLLPPRFLPANFGFVDTLNAVGGVGSFDSALMKDAGNLFAAMPSLHIAWALWCVFALVPVVRRRWIKALLIAHPFVTLFTIIVTGNHYFLDAAGGVAVFCLGLAIANIPRPAFTFAPLAYMRQAVPAVARIRLPAAWLPWLSAQRARTASLAEALRARTASLSEPLKLRSRLRKPAVDTGKPTPSAHRPANDDDTPAEVTLGA